jgi:hypothetical protein
VICYQSNSFLRYILNGHRPKRHLKTSEITAEVNELDSWLNPLPCWSAEVCVLDNHGQCLGITHCTGLRMWTGERCADSGQRECLTVICEAGATTGKKLVIKDAAGMTHRCYKKRSCSRYYLKGCMNGRRRES